MQSVNYLQKVNWKLVARTIFSVGLLAWLAGSMQWKELGQAITRVEPLWILVAIAMIVLSMVVSVMKWRLVLHAQGIDLVWSNLWRAYWAGLFCNNFLPSSIGGDALRIIWVGKISRDAPGAAASVIVERILATAGLALTGLVAAAYVAHPDKRAVILFAGLTAISILLLGLIAWGGFPAWSKHNKGRFTEFLSRMIHHGSRLKYQPTLLTQVGMLSIIFQVVVVGVNYAIFRALHINGLTAWDLLYVIPVISVAAMLPLGINGYGLREGAYITMLGFYQIPASTAFSASLLFVFLVSLCSLYGGYIWFKHRTGGDFADVKTPSFPNRPGRDEVWL
jgi:uncharacterized protein (TIRG00374 family)